MFFKLGKRFFPALLVILFLLVVIVGWNLTVKKSRKIALVSVPPAISQKTNISTGNVPKIPFVLPSGYVIHQFAEGLGSPRVMKFSPGGTLLVSDIQGNRIIALPDNKHQGAATSQKVVVSSGNHLHGLAFYGGKLYVAEVDKVVRYNWDERTLTASFDKVLFTLPGNNDHNNRTITFDSSGRMYVSVGSTCDVCLESSPLSATVLISDADGNNPRVFAKGLRNAAFTAMNPVTNELWGTEMGRDYLGDNVPPDEINIIRAGADYGWPFCYGNKIFDTNFGRSQTDPCPNTQGPLYEIPAHSAPLGLSFINSPQFPGDWQNDLLVAYHGSWNRTVPSGYKIVHMKVVGNQITRVDDFLTGFLQGGMPLARPVDLVFDSLGNLYISDDKAGNIYLVQKQQ